MGRFSIVDSEHTDEANVLRRLVTAFPSEIRRLRLEVLKTTMASGVPVDPGAVTVVLAAHLDRAAEPLQFTPEHVAELLWYGIIRYCDDVGIGVPPGSPLALHALLAVLVGSGRLSAAVSPGPLFEPFDELGSLAAAG